MKSTSVKSTSRKLEPAPRVALLARPGPACERLRAALQSGGNELVLEADPTVIDVAALAAVAPQAVVVVLDAAVEDVLDGFDALLADPAIDVLYEEAALATAREGWDVARWTRHLSAKLLHHGDVLPPGREPDADPRIDTGAVQAAQSAPALESAGFDPVAAEYVPDESVSGEAATDPGAMHEALAAAVPEPSPAAREPAYDDLSLSVESGADEPPIEPAAGTDGRVHDLAAIQRRIATMTLVATPESESESQSEPEWRPESQPQLPAADADADTLAEVARGAVLVLAGIGGPDAIRQLLGELPKGFPRPILIQQRLDGGRHDRLVQQMTRVTELPVHLAEAGAAAQAGHVYILPPALGVVSGDAGLRFREGDQDMIAALPADDSAVLMLSGSDAGLVDAAMRHAGTGAFVAGQSPDGCYDSAASAVLVARGGESGQPADLARRLVQRWAH